MLWALQLKSIENCTNIYFYNDLFGLQLNLLNNEIWYGQSKEFWANMYIIDLSP